MSQPIEVRIDDGADAGTVFVVSRMSLLKGDNWANRVALALCRSGIDISELGLVKGQFNGLLDVGRLAGVALKALGGMDEATAQGLLGELLTNVKIKLADGSTRPVIIQSDDGYDSAGVRTGDITCIKTLWKLRVAAIKVNLDFLMEGVTQ